MTTALIDADSIIYIIAWNFRDEFELGTDAVKRGCDSFIDSILRLTQSDRYIGVFSSKTNFRHDLYKYQPYKGNRGAKPDCVIFWGPVIKEHLTSQWGFYTSNELEADDIIVAAAALSGESGENVIICSPDKDLRQMAGFHYDYRVASGIQTVTKEQAARNLWSQVLTGDSTDNIAGLPKLGEVKVKKLFDTLAETEVLTEISMMLAVRAEFTKYFGYYYGEIIYNETLQTVMMVQPAHPRWSIHEEEILHILKTHVQATPTPTVPEELELDGLGWLS